MGLKLADKVRILKCANKAYIGKLGHITTIYQQSTGLGDGKLVPHLYEVTVQEDNTQFVLGANAFEPWDVNEVLLYEKDKNKV